MYLRRNNLLQHPFELNFVGFLDGFGIFFKIKLLRCFVATLRAIQCEVDGGQKIVEIIFLLR